VIEFTGERVIPGEVEDDLWAEHAARYAFASRFAEGRRALDIGCGAGYGTAALSARVAVGVDSAADAVAFSRAHYPSCLFAQASAAALPFCAASFDVAIAFEVIEHLTNWRELLAEARRVLQPDGVFLVSTPNKLFYAESRAQHGPNPFHEHEFEYAEFRDALGEFFPSVTVMLQNRLDAFAFYSAEAAGLVDAHIEGTRGAPEEAHFFIAICSHRFVPLRSFVYVPAAANLLRERERHIALLEQELKQSKAWLDQTIAEHGALVELHATQTAQLEEHNRWALKLESDWRAALQRITQLQDEFKAEQEAAARVVARYDQKVAELEEENRARAQWAVDTETRLTADLSSKCSELGDAVRLLDAAEATVTERTLWAQKLQSRLDVVEQQLRMVRDSRWLRLGRTVGLGPRVEN
jgi:SAM-dependent methyltransferase